MKRPRAALRRGADDRGSVGSGLEIADILLANLENASLGKLPVEKSPLDGTATRDERRHHKHRTFLKDSKRTRRINGRRIFQSRRGNVAGGIGQNKLQLLKTVI